MKTFVDKLKDEIRVYHFYLLPPAVSLGAGENEEGKPDICQTLGGENE